MKKAPRVFATIATVALGLALTACGSTAKPAASQNTAGGGGGGGSQNVVKIRLAFVSGKGSMPYDAAQMFKKEIEEQSHGHIQVTVYSDGQLGQDLNVLNALKSGSIEMDIPSTVMAQVIPEFGVFDIPFLFKDRDAVAKIAHGDIWNKDLKAKLDEKGFVGLGFWENGYRQITNNKRPIYKPDDLKGLKLRVPDSKIRVALFKELGANPTPMDLTEVFSALQQGVIDGQENPLATIKGSKFQEVQKYLSITNHVYTPSYLIASKVWFDKLSPDDQKLIQQVADHVGDEIRQEGATVDNQIIEEFKKAGMQVNQADIPAFQAKVGPVIDLMKQQIDPAFVDKVIKEAQS
ncbi:TRAP transporter substrate-binding protein [Alicyclobacillus sp.]|uniref:TRAP transporter substrate-binding protein n=1 Tax=Alicyclobacillus sp. TaxID=61169 RepID=UPI0025C57BD4|nr:TRAP transporter substrate-binding protein [Alicyclobacillus sp.]MCL6517434.1 TRAP transporter substrate-binding protein [Alicyclobacillus sp.]